jgi:hypothetical protein
MDAAELDERIRRLEARVGIAVEVPSWPDPNRLAVPRPWTVALPSPTRVAPATGEDDELPPAA